MTSGRPDPGCSGNFQRPWQCRARARNGLDAQGMRAGTTAARISRRCASRVPHGPADRYSGPLLSSQALPAFWQSTSATGLVCRKEDRSGRDGPDDRAEGAGKGAGRRGHPQRLLEYRLALVRSLTRSAWKANLTFEVGAEELNGIADRSVVWRFVSMPSSIC